MWGNLSSLAKKAKEAAALIEEQINDSIGAGAEGRRGDATTSDGDGWEKCDDGEEAKEKMLKETSPQEMSFVDLKSAAESIPKTESGGRESDATMLNALARIESLEKQVGSLKVDLALAREAAREESENYHATNLLLEQQVKELQEENSVLKESASASKT
mmetsp:Transcript_34383/g.63210  ORF Transcript_34383/g.63210 Transcript_34383/m.63210 type:complete len:160 (+) Transcript_34383:244-723(+)|eukprot:CAMPEP_0201660872 /NCGR_PEP_ID=MMETSP0494-20130426/3395_1 /ASSEMBLY_ACC=CAM_ASM_000839 /TAXON_ID=420259 /ORGANISM="Thalassiosira gravida, Strain GMp14c1" /LENGTH=159 /DNA_ID=CAMNT_0048138843 /DNA_START=142 /DNA_END=621 /DNA_ORIENTATION=-